MLDNQIQELQVLAEQIRLKSLQSIASFGSGHVGGVLSLAELFAVLYGSEMVFDAKEPLWPLRDRLVLSKGHCGPVLYATLALMDFFPLAVLDTLNQNGSILPSHCNMYDTPGVDVGTGSLGQGASIAAGLALGLRMRGSTSKVFLILGDGECNEGQVWEMALFAAQHKIDNLIAFVDLNHQQLDGFTDDICSVGDIREKFKNFGWNTIQVDGHDIQEIQRVIEVAKRCKDQPSMIVLDTIKGKGWVKTEGKPNVHYTTISQEEFILAEKEISTRISLLKKNITGGASNHENPNE